MKKMLLVLAALAVMSVPVWVQASCAGDLDGDGYITTDDLSAMMFIIANPGWILPPENGEFSADMDGDGYVTVDDLSALMFIIANAPNGEYWLECDSGW